MYDLLFFSGSSRKSSVNTRLAQAAAEVANSAFDDDVRVSVIDLADFDVPAFDVGEATINNFPENVRKLKTLIGNSDGIFIGSDEYTGTYSTLFRNLIDWLMQDSQKSGNIFARKPILLCGASPQGVGGLRGHPALHQLLTIIGATVISQHISLGTSPTPFDKTGQLLPRVEKQLRGEAINRLISAINKLAGE